MSDPMAEIRASFFIECEELLESLQDALNDMDEGVGDNETINVVFRAVHSIKGGAGAFSLNALVAFAHRYETVMDEVRSGKLEVTPDAIKLFFHAADLLSDHVRSARDDTPPPADSESCLQELEALMGIDPGMAAAEEEAAASDFQPMGLALDLDFGDAGAFGMPEPGATEIAETRITVTFTPRRELYASGNEPLHLLRALTKLAEEVDVTTDLSGVPSLEALDPEQSHLSWTVTLRGGDVSESDIRDIFDFVEDVCDLSITTEGEVGGPFGLEADAGFGIDTSPPVDPVAGGALSGALPTAASAAPSTVQLSAPTVPDTAPSSARPDHPEPPMAMDPPPSQPPATGGGGRGGATPGGGAAAASSGNAETGATVRVDLERIDRLVNLVGELVINQAMLAQSVSEAGLPPNSAVMTGLEAFMMLTRDIQDSVMMIRAQPVKPLFQRMGRIVREASGAVGKEVKLKVEGETTEVDKTVIERLADPLTHMIRNSVDHGLEKPEDRLKAGKPEEGVITLSAQHRSGRVVIEVEDDGAGINRPKVLRKAIEKGLVPPDAQLSDGDIDNLLFLPGFSTADQVSALSGRGVGMDVVRSSIQSLGGRITIQSEPGKGTVFSISLPLTLAVLDGMVVTVADETLVVPLSSILETTTLTQGDIRALGPNTNVIHVRGEFVPLYDLGAELGYRGTKSDYEGCIALLTAQENGTRSALIVDAIMEQRQVVIKGLQRSYGHIPGVAAATILGDGQIALILDPADLVQNATGHTRSADFALAG